MGMLTAESIDYGMLSGHEPDGVVDSKEKGLVDRSGLI